MKPIEADDAPMVQPAHTWFEHRIARPLLAFAGDRPTMLRSARVPLRASSASWAASSVIDAAFIRDTLETGARMARRRSPLPC